MGKLWRHFLFLLLFNTNDADWKCFWKCFWRLEKVHFGVSDVLDLLGRLFGHCLHLRLELLHLQSLLGPLLHLGLLGDQLFSTWIRFSRSNKSLLQYRGILPNDDACCLRSKD